MSKNLRPYHLLLSGGLVDTRFRVLLAQEKDFAIYAAPASVSNTSEFFGDVFLYAVMNKGNPYQFATFNSNNELVWSPSFDEVPTEEDTKFIKEYFKTFYTTSDDVEVQIKNLFNSLVDGKLQAVMA